MEIHIPLLKAGAALELRVTEDCKAGSVLSFTCEAFQGGAKAAEAKITVLERGSENEN
jgi:hypothetical protein